MQARQLRIEGDFDIRMDYELVDFPRPKREWINAEIFIEGPDGKAAVIPVNHSEHGSGCSLWFEPAAGRSDSGKWHQVPSDDVRGTLRLERVGKTLRYHRCADGNELFEELGIVEFGADMVYNVEFRVLVPETKTAVRVQIDNVIVEADRLIGPPSPAQSIFGPASWIGAIVVVVIAGGLSLWWWRIRRGR